MIEVFRTNVEEAYEADRIAKTLLQHFPDSLISFDLEDCDRILRVKGPNLSVTQILDLVNAQGFLCSVLD